MDDEDLTLLDVEPDASLDDDNTPVTPYAFTFMATAFTKKVHALRAAAQQVHQLTPVAAQLLASALYEVLEVGHDFHRLLTSMSFEKK